MADEMTHKNGNGHRTQVLSLFAVYLLLALLLLEVAGFWYWRSHNTARDVSLFADEARVSADGRGYDAAPFIKAVGGAKQLENDTSLALNVLLVLVLVLYYREAVLIYQALYSASEDGKALRLPLPLNVSTQRRYGMDVKYARMVIPLLLALMGTVLFLDYRKGLCLEPLNTLTRSARQPSSDFADYYMRLTRPGATVYVSLSLFWVAGLLCLPALTWLRLSIREAVHASTVEQQGTHPSTRPGGQGG